MFPCSLRDGKDSRHEYRLQGFLYMRRRKCVDDKEGDGAKGKFVYTPLTARS